MITIEQFRATRTECADLGEAMGADYFENSPRAGFIYTGDCYIEQEADGSFYLIIYNDEYTSTDLAELEARLYAFALTECPDDMGVTPADENALIAALVTATDTHPMQSRDEYMESIADTVVAVLNSDRDMVNMHHIAECTRAKHERRIRDALAAKMGAQS